MTAKQVKEKAKVVARAKLIVYLSDLFGITLKEAASVVVPLIPITRKEKAE